MIDHPEYSAPDSSPPGGAEPHRAVTVYWRPGCPYCWALRRGLRRAGVDVVERDIWSDADAAAFVRSHARGNETVPTVDVAGMVLVNPTTRRVLETARIAGLRVPPPSPRWWPRRRGRTGT